MNGPQAAGAYFGELIFGDRYSKRERRAMFEAWKRFEPEPVYGSAKWACAEMLKKAGVFEDRGGLYVAKFDGKPCFDNSRMSAVDIGGSGEGKGLKQQEALLRSKDRSWIVADIDGEAFYTTAEQRARRSRTIIVDAYEMVRGIYRIPRGHYNPMGLHYLDPRSRQFLPRCGKLTADLIPKGTGREMFFHSSARSLTADFIMTQRLYGNSDKANLTEVAKMAHGDPCHFFRWATRSNLIRDKFLFARAQRWANPRRVDIRSLPEVFETVRTYLSPWLDEAVAAVTRDTTFTFSEAAEDEMTIMLMTPHDVLTSPGVARVFTTFMGCATNEVLRFNPDRNKHVTFLMDEFYDLPLEDMDRRLVGARKHNASFWFFLQDISQLSHSSMYPETWQSWLQNCSSVAWLSARSLHDSELVSKLLGEKEVIVTNRNRSLSALHMFMSDPPTTKQLERLNVSVQEAQVARPLMLPQDIRYMKTGPDGKQIHFLRGVPAPILSDHTSYLKDPKMVRIAGENPYYRNKPVPSWRKLLA